MGDLIPIKVGRITSNDEWPLVYIPAEAIQWVIAGISSTGIGGVLGQGIADGMSRGLTSSQGKKILEAQNVKNSAAPAGNQG